MQYVVTKFLQGYVHRNVAECLDVKSLLDPLPYGSTLHAIEEGLQPL